MKESPVTNEFKIVQIFLPVVSSKGPEIYEVSSNEVTLKCTCPTYAGKNKCKHLDFVQARIDSNGGKNYPLEISSRATPEQAKKAQESAENFRDFVIMFGKIEVI